MINTPGQSAAAVMPPAIRVLAGFVCALALYLGLLASQVVTAQELTLGGFVAAKVEETVEESVEESVEDVVEDSVAESVEDVIEEQVVDAVVDEVEERVEEEAQLTLGGFVAAKVEDKVEEDIEQEVEQSLEDELTESLEDAIEADVEEAVAETVEEEIGEDIEDSIEESIAANVEDAVQDSVEDVVETEVEESVAEAVEENLEQDVEESVASSVEQEIEAGVEAVAEIAAAEAVEERLEGEIDELIQDIESNFDVDEKRIHRGQWLVMAEPEVFEELAEEGYIFDTITDLPGMGMRLAEVAAPASFDISTAREGVFDVVGSGRAEVDLNHIYTAGTPDSTTSEGGVSPRDAIHFPDDTGQLALKIGMIDSSVDRSHPALRRAKIENRSFVSEGAEQPLFHGTAIASIIAANDSGFLGLAPDAELYAASVFEKDGEQGEIASTVSLVRALDWLISSGVDAVNISLAGPPNRLLEAALARVAKQDVMVLAAAGNGGPMAKPMFPAAYDSVVAVTAVDELGQVFRLANRGSYLDIAAPGVDLRHARAGGGYAASSGTSFAVPFAVTAAARLRQLAPEEDALATLYSGARDLGPPGRDEIYGYGLLNP